MDRLAELNVGIERNLREVQKFYIELLEELRTNANGASRTLSLAAYELGIATDLIGKVELRRKAQDALGMLNKSMNGGEPLGTEQLEFLRQQMREILKEAHNTKA